ncbi:MAG: hypothetical protein NZM37_11075, partial [Sandaracinaceae bacterium]|nr:hypothetical protein [Sandaracinaceae bacterium]
MASFEPGLGYSQRVRFLFGFFILLTPSLLFGCPPSSPSPHDGGGGDGGAADVSDASSGCTPMVLRALTLSPSNLGVTPGAFRFLDIESASDACADTLIDVAASVDGIVRFPRELRIAQGDSKVRIEIEGLRPGRTELIFRVHGTAIEARAEVVVVEDRPPPCSGEGSGMVYPNGTPLRGNDALSQASLRVPMGAASGEERYRVSPFEARITCDTMPIPPGYRALGPAVSFRSPTVYRFPREVEFSIPIRLALLPSRAHRGHVEVLYRGPGISTPRIVPIANPRFAGNAEEGALHFWAPRLGTYQAVVRTDVPRQRIRRFTFRGIIGFSMGGSGAARIGLANPDLFDFIAPLGGPTDWIYLLEYIRRYHLGGFCTFEERLRDTDGRCNRVNRERPPPRGELFEHTQTFENWWYEDMYDGQGGRFNRDDYISIFRDLAMMFGNPNTDTNPIDIDPPTQPSIAPPGTPEEWRRIPDAMRCGDGASPIVIRGHCPTANPGDPCTPDTDPKTGWYDDEYNPDGRWDAISFCDGAEIDVGNWDPSGRQFIPVEVAYAIDINHNGRRDPGEPVVRNGREPFEDFGCDRTPSPMEPGYHPIENPDPSGDDYDFQYNPSGTEGNYDYDGEGSCPPGQGERFEDVG